jgi:hypothetical protein
MRRLIVAIALLATAAPAAGEDYPHVYLKNDKLKVKVYLPDAEKGFYRGTRFDHAGVFGEIEFAGHKIFGPWKDKHDPTNHDDIIGPCEEFGIEKPLGYDDAKPGETFLKIGVGELEKPKEDKYSFAKKYKIVKPAGWKETERDLEVKAKRAPLIEWKMEQKANGYGYEYQKVVSLFGNEATLLIVHSLKNTGEKPIATEVYNHNFFNVDGDSVGPNYSFAFPFELKAQDLKGKFGELVELKGKQLRFKDKLDDGFVMAGLTGFDPTRRGDRAFEMRHGPSGVRVSVAYIQPFSKFNIWGIKTTICPEPFTRIELKPGEGMVWRLGYSFVHEPPK